MALSPSKRRREKNQDRAADAAAKAEADELARLQAEEERQAENAEFLATEGLGFSEGPTIDLSLDGEEDELDDDLLGLGLFI